MKKILLLAVILWGLLAPFSYHPDTKLTLEYPALENGKVWDIYSYLDKNKLSIPDFHYPPAHYWWLKIHYPISKLIGGSGFDQWLKSGSVQAVFDENILRYNLAAKLPLLILGILSGYLIYLIVRRWGKNESWARMAAVVWFFNPVTLYSLVMMGQNDIVAIFLFLLGVYFIEKWWLTALLWGFAAGVKSYPIIWSIMFLLAYEKNVFKLIGKIGSVVLVYLLILMPWLDKSYFVSSVLNSGLSQRMFIANIGIGFGKEILIIPLVLIIIGLMVFRKKIDEKISLGAKSVFLASLIILGFSHFNPQWMMWVVPFFLIWRAILGFEKEDILAWFLILMAWIVLILGFDDKFLVWGILAPINPNLLNYPTLVELLRNKGVEMSQMINLAQTVLVGLSLWFLIQQKDKDLIKKTSGLKLNKIAIVCLWFIVLVIVFLVAVIKVDVKTESQKTDTRMKISDTSIIDYRYTFPKNLKYLEISLDNPQLNSRDNGILIVQDAKGNQIEKKFSGFNAETEGWLRVDIPKNMANSSGFRVSLKEVNKTDGLLEFNLDKHGKWAINSYTRGTQPFNGLMSKILSFWWWWGLMILLSGYFVYLDNRKK